MITRSCSIKGLVINVRGINASGKSTAVREFCRTFDLKPYEVAFMGEKYKLMTDRKRVVFGWYKPYSNSEGLDSLAPDKESFKKFFEYVLKKIKPCVVVYEKQIWSTTYKLTSEIAEISRRCGYQFAAVQMCIDYQTALNRLFIRNGGNIGNLDNFDGRFYATYNAMKNLKNNGEIVYEAHVERIPKENMQDIIPAVISLLQHGVRGENIEKIITGTHG